MRRRAKGGEIARRVVRCCASFGANSFRTRRGPQTAATLLLNLRHRILTRFVSKGVGFGYVTAGGTGLRAFAAMLQGVRVAQSWRATVVARDRHARNYSVPARSCDVMLEETVGLRGERESRCAHTCQGVFLDTHSRFFISKPPVQLLVTPKKAPSRTRS